MWSVTNRVCIILLPSLAIIGTGLIRVKNISVYEHKFKVITALEVSFLLRMLHGVGWLRHVKYYQRASLLWNIPTLPNLIPFQVTSVITGDIPGSPVIYGKNCWTAIEKSIRLQLSPSVNWSDLAKPVEKRSLLILYCIPQVSEYLLFFISFSHLLKCILLTLASSATSIFFIICYCCGDELHIIC